MMVMCTWKLTGCFPMWHFGSMTQGVPPNCFCG